MKASGNVANLSDRFIDEAGQVVQLSGVAGSFAIKVACESLYGKGRTENVLAEVIMHFPADPLLLAFRGIEKRMLQELHFGHVPDHQKMSLGLGGNLARPNIDQDGFACLSFGRRPRSVLPTIRDPTQARLPSLPSGARSDNLRPIISFCSQPKISFAAALQEANSCAESTVTRAISLASRRARIAVLSSSRVASVAPKPLS